MANIHTKFSGEEGGLVLSEDSQSTCFICTKQLSALNDRDQSYKREYSIRTIFKHLKINLTVKTQTEDNQPVDVVPFCDPCYQIIKTLSSYCADLEVLQMRIAYFFTELNKLTVVETMQFNIGTIDKARLLLKEKLKEKFTSSYHAGPFVSLPKLNIEQAKTTADQTTEPSSENVSCDEYEPQDEEMSTDDESHCSDLDNESDINPGSKNKSNQSKSTRRSPKPNKEDGLAFSSNKKIPCLECDLYFQMPSCLFAHSVQFHPEKHFPSSEAKPNNLTTSQHNMYLTHLFNTEINSCGSWITGYKCTYCQFNTKTKLSIRMHLFKIHQNKLSENLVQLQEDISPEKLSKIVKLPILPNQNRHGKDKEENFQLQQFCKSKKKMKSEYICSICEVRTTSPRKHEALHHPEKFLLSKRLENVSPEHFKMYCVHLINKLVENFTKSGEDRKVRFHCPHCQKSYIDLQGCRNHMVLGHVDLLSVEIEKLQKIMKPEELKVVKIVKRSSPQYYLQSIKQVVQVSTIKCKICSVRLTQRGLAIHMRKNHPNEYVKSFKCEVCIFCKKSFRSKWWLDYHTTSVHPNAIFENRKLVETTVEQFKSYCDYVIEREISFWRKVDATDEKIRYKCSYCKNTFIDVKYAQIHLVMKHEEILGGKLEEIQKSKRVEEIENDKVIKREIGGERFEEEDDFEATEVFCGRSVLKEEEGERWDENGDEMGDLDELNENSNAAEEDVEIKQEGKMDVQAILPN